MQKPNAKTSHKIVMTRRGIVMYDPSIPMTARFDRKESDEFLRHKHDWDKLDEHCEIAHIEITPNCNRQCVYCYNPKDEPQLDMKALQDIMDNLAKAKVFQITFGGGEPFLRKDIFALALYARSVGLNVCATTNGDILGTLCEGDPDCSDIAAFGQINVSYHGDDLFFKNLARIAPICKKHNVKLGINFCCQDSYMESLELVAKQAALFNAELLLLAYKPVRVPISGPSQVQILIKAFELASRYKINTAVDGACARRCYASLKFADIHADGTVSVCSFLRQSIGNSLKEDFTKIWARRPKEIECPYFPGVKNNPRGTSIL